MHIDDILHAIRAAGHPLRIAITGGRHVGKTTTLKRLFRSCIDAGLDARGFAETAVFQGETRIGYDFVDLTTGEICTVARRKEPCGYDFRDDAWRWAEARLRRDQGGAIQFVDEIGRLEARNGGFMPALCRTLAAFPRHLVAAVRDDAVEPAAALCGDWDVVCCGSGITDAACNRRGPLLPPKISSTPRFS